MFIDFEKGTARPNLSAVEGKCHEVESGGNMTQTLSTDEYSSTLNI